MANQQKTVPTDESVAGFVASIAGARRDEATRLVEILGRASGHAPRMWGTSMIGFGEYRYGQAGGQRNLWFLTGFAVRKSALTVYILTGFNEWPELMERLGRHDTGAGCLYLKRLADVDEVVLEELIRRSVTLMRHRHRD